MKKQFLAIFMILAILMTVGCAAPAGKTPSGSQDSSSSGGTAPSVEGGASQAEWGNVPPSSVGDGSFQRGEYYPRSGESYLGIDENPVKQVERDPLSTFSLKVDTAAYTNIVRYLQSGNLPPADAVRVEEMINYFNYEAEMRFDGHPFSIYTELGPSPFDPGKYMAFIRVKAREIEKRNLPSSNLTFLIDTSGSMDSYDKLPLLKEAFSLLVDTLDESDVVSIVTYAGSAGVVLDSVSGADKQTILRAIHSLQPGGSTAGADGILTAYALAEKNFRPGGNNRVILATDGDFNVGTSDTDALSRLISEKRGSDIYLSVLGFGTGNIRDDIMETLAKDGNGNYAYISSVATAKKVLVDELASNLFTIADDVKAQVEFNPKAVQDYRLIGYENRQLEDRDFEDDTKDAGEIGVGTDVVFMYELTLRGGGQQPGLKYSANHETTEAIAYADELFEVRIRYKQPGQPNSQLMTRPVVYGDIARTSSADYDFACSVALFGALLRGSPYAGRMSIAEISAMASESLGRDEGGYRVAHLDVLREYRRVTNR